MLFYDYISVLFLFKVSNRNNEQQRQQREEPNDGVMWAKGNPVDWSTRLI